MYLLQSIQRPQKAHPSRQFAYFPGSFSAAGGLHQSGFQSRKYRSSGSNSFHSTHMASKIFTASKKKKQKKKKNYHIFWGGALRGMGPGVSHRSPWLGFGPVWCSRVTKDETSESLSQPPATLQIPSSGRVCFNSGSYLGFSLTNEKVRSLIILQFLEDGTVSEK